MKQLQHTSETLETYICNIGEEKAVAAAEKSDFEQHHGKRRGSAPGSDSRNMPGDSREWQTGTSPELPWTSWSTTFVKVVDALAVTDGRHLLLLLARRRRRCQGQQVVLPPDRAAASTARRGRAERSSGGGGRDRNWREAGRQMGWL
jgi:hypothetical protein